MLCLVQFLGFELFTAPGSAMEHWMLDMPVKFLLLPAAMAEPGTGTGSGSPRRARRANWKRE